MNLMLKFIYSDKTTKILRNPHLFLTGTTYSQKKWRFRKNFVAFSEYMNFIKPDICRSLYPSQNGIKLGKRITCADSRITCVVCVGGNFINYRKTSTNSN